MRRKVKIAFFLLFLIFFTGFIFSSMTLAFVNLPAEYWYEIISYEKEKPKNVTLILPIPYIDGKPVVEPSSNPNVTIIDTSYGKMLKIELEEADLFPVVTFVTSDRTIDIVNTNITLSPMLEKEFISKTENEKELSEKYRIKIPVYTEFEGTGTMTVEFTIYSGFKALPSFFFIPIPWEPRYGWKPYAGHKIIEFRITSKGWQVVDGEERIGITYQRMW